jgi:hypothetical protein
VRERSCFASKVSVAIPFRSDEADAGALVELGADPLLQLVEHPPQLVAVLDLSTAQPGLDLHHLPLRELAKHRVQPIVRRLFPGGEPRREPSLEVGHGRGHRLGRGVEQGLGDRTQHSVRLIRPELLEAGPSLHPATSRLRLLVLTVQQGAPDLQVALPDPARVGRDACDAAPWALGVELRADAPCLSLQPRERFRLAELRELDVADGSGLGDGAERVLRELRPEDGELLEPVGERGEILLHSDDDFLDLARAAAVLEGRA